MNVVNLKTQALDDKIATAFDKNVTSKIVAGVLAKAEASLAKAAETAEQARTRALSPSLTSKEVADAKRDMDDAAFARDRLEAAIPNLQKRLKCLRDLEEEHRRREKYKKVKAERDALAEELARNYHVLVDKLTDLLTRLAANEADIRNVNIQLPGMLIESKEKFEWLSTADDIARGVHDFEHAHFKKSKVHLIPPIPRLVQSIKLPKVTAAYGHSWAWPPERDPTPERPPGVPDHYLPILASRKNARIDK